MVVSKIFGVYIVFIEVKETTVDSGLETIWGYNFVLNMVQNSSKLFRKISFVKDADVLT